MNPSTPFDSMPAWLLIVLGIVFLVQIGFAIYSLVDLVKRPADQLTLGGRKWLWGIIIGLGFLSVPLGTIAIVLYLAAGRRQAPAEEAEHPVPIADRAESAADSLYGPREWSGRS